MHYLLFGGLRALAGSGAVDLGGPKQRSVLAALLLDAGRPVTADRLVDLVWGDDPPNRAEVSLQAYVSNLRRALEPDRRPREAPRILLTSPAGYSVAADRADIDALRFEDLAAEGHRLFTTGDAPGAATVLDEALAIARGSLLPELHHEPWVVDATTRLDDVLALAQEDRFAAGLTLGEHRHLIPRIETAVAEHPYRERLRHQLALALYRADRQRDALHALSEARTAFGEGAGIEPGPALRQLEADILAQAPHLDLVAPPVEDRRRQEDPAWTAPGRDRRAHAPQETQPTDGAMSARGRTYVGRARELAALHDAFTTASTGTGLPVVISGEPGIGKTRLVEELVALLPGAAVAWGRCPEHATNAAYWPCIQIGRQLEGADVLTSELVGDLLPEDDAPISNQPGADHLGLHMAIGAALSSARRPIVLVVDDVQWADAASLRVFEFLAGDLRRLPILVILTTRPPGPDSPAALVDCLGEMARQPGALRIELDGLDRDDVAAWIATRGGSPADPSVAAAVHDRTGGNPFFVGEVVELLATGSLLDPPAAGPVVPVPAAVQDVVRRRVGSLPESSRTLLAAASVVGRVFDLDVLGAVVGQSIDQVLDDLDPPLAAGLVGTGDDPGRFQFSHALVADALAAELTAIRRARLHAAVARSLVSLRAAHLEGFEAEVAHHATAGMAAGTAEMAHEWSIRAARSATAGLAHEDAAAHWARAAQAVAVARPADRGERYEALLEQGRSLVRADTVERGFVALGAAIDLAIAMHDPERVCAAASVMNVEGAWFAGEIDFTLTDPFATLTRALDAITDAPPGGRALVMSALADHAYWRWPAERLEACTAEAVELARQSGDGHVLARTLHKRSQALWRAATADQRRETGIELLHLLEHEDVPAPLVASALLSAAGSAWELGDVPEVERLLEETRALTDEVSSPAIITQHGFFRASVRTLQGRFADALDDIEQSFELYRRTRGWNAEAFRAGFSLLVLTEQGRLDDVVALERNVTETPYRPWFQEGFAWALAELGELERARQLLDGVLPPDVDCWLYLGVTGAAAHTRCILGDTDGAAVLLERMAPYRDRLAATGTGAAFGPVAGAMARVGLLLGDEAQARSDVDAAMVVAERAGEGPWLARTLLLRSEITGEVADRDRAAEMIRRLGLPLLASRV